jgi:hypothetical protein
MGWILFRTTWALTKPGGLWGGHHGKAIMMVGTLDTKGDKLIYLKERIERLGHPAIVVDIGIILGEAVLLLNRQVRCRRGTNDNRRLLASRPSEEPRTSTWRS